MRRLLFLLTLSLGSSAFGRVHMFSGSYYDEKIEKHKLKPLVESSYWKDHPGSLPYSKCRITAIDGRKKIGEKLEFIVGASTYDGPYTVFCYSEKLRVAYMIPIELANDRSVGLAVNLSEIRVLSGRLRDVKGHKLSEIFGKYKGFNGGIGIVGSVSGAVLKNENDIMMTLNESGSIGLVELSLAYRKIHVQSRPLIETEIYTDDFLAKRHALMTEAGRSLQEVLQEGDFEQRMQRLENERQLLDNWPEAKKYHHLSTYWIHNLTPEGKNPQNRFQELSKDFMDSLEFKKS
ncbi:MAG: hypothetical protein HYW48_05930 [Deltaproteobacteria bacterium]|nr:hypothetical protein [Deltaproteobacteria bacterium]